MPPVLHVAVDELVLRAQQQVVARQLRLGMQHRHRVLQLVAEAERAARLVVAAARGVAAADGLVQQPEIGSELCWDKVCPYVLITVCAVSLKKKKYYNNHNEDKN